MTEGEMVKLYAKRENIKEADLANAIGISEGELPRIYECQTVEPDVKQKLQAFFKRNIFDGSILTEYFTNVPDEQANKMKG